MCINSAREWASGGGQRTQSCTAPGSTGSDASWRVALRKADGRQERCSSPQATIAGLTSSASGSGTGAPYARRLGHLRLRAACATPSAGSGGVAEASAGKKKGSAAARQVPQQAEARDVRHRCGAVPTQHSRRRAALLRHAG